MKIRRFPDLALCVVSLLFLIPGCTGAAGSGSNHEVAPVEPGPGSVPALATSSLHDFGTVFADGQTLRHDFVLENPTDRPADRAGPGDGLHALLLDDRAVA